MTIPKACFLGIDENYETLSIYAVSSPWTGLTTKVIYIPHILLNQGLTWNTKTTSPCLVECGLDLGAITSGQEDGSCIALLGMCTLFTRELECKSSIIWVCKTLRLKFNFFPQMQISLDVRVWQINFKKIINEGCCFALELKKITTELPKLW